MGKVEKYAHALALNFSLCTQCMTFRGLVYTSFSKVTFVTLWKLWKAYDWLGVKSQLGVGILCKYAMVQHMTVYTNRWLHLGMHVCMCVFLSIGRRTYAIAAACLFSLAIFSCWPCQGPQNYPPTVGSSGLQCIGLLQTWVINLCHLFIHLTKHTCSPPLLPTTPDVSKIHATQWT